VKALVTGATGFIGRYLTLELLRSGYDVCVAVRDPDKLKNAGFEGNVKANAFDLMIFQMGICGAILIDLMSFFTWLGKDCPITFHVIKLKRMFPGITDFLRPLQRAGAQKSLSLERVPSMETNRGPRRKMLRRGPTMRMQSPNTCCI
jgi:hypothetical protein